MNYLNNPQSNSSVTVSDEKRDFIAMYLAKVPKRD